MSELDTNCQNDKNVDNGTDRGPPSETGPIGPSTPGEVEMDGVESLIHVQQNRSANKGDEHSNALERNTEEIARLNCELAALRHAITELVRARKEPKNKTWNNLLDFLRSIWDIIRSWGEASARAILARLHGERNEEQDPGAGPQRVFLTTMVLTISIFVYVMSNTRIYHGVTSSNPEFMLEATLASTIDPTVQHTLEPMSETTPFTLNWGWNHED